MRQIVIIGGGFAGVWSAASAVRALRQFGAGSDTVVTLVSKDEYLILRPRLYEARPEALRVPLDTILRPIGVRRIMGTVTGIDTGMHRVEVAIPGGAAACVPALTNLREAGPHHCAALLRLLPELTQVRTSPDA